MNRLTRWLRPETLFGRTVLALAAAFLAFGFVSAILLQVTLVRPHTKQAADDLAAFLVLAAQIWVELPPFTRPDYEKELSRRHDLRILPAEAVYPSKPSSHAYLSYLEAALAGHIGQPVHIHQHPDHEGWLWADFPMGGRIMRLGFRESRLQNPIILILPFLAAIGLLAAFAASVLLVRRVTLPLARMSAATHRIGEGDFSRKIPETGPREIADLARKLNRMEDQIGLLLESRTTLLAGISHDLRTPLARMRLELALMHGGETDAAIQGLNDDISEMEKLISQALLLARGIGDEQAEATDIAALIEQLADDFRKAGSPVDLSTMSTCVRPVQSNALKRVLSNLIDNALIYSGGQAVTLGCLCSDEGVRISVSDRGPGIPASERENVFLPFHRLEGSRNKATGGSGLGLAIVQQLCRINGWIVDIIEPDTGSGCVFAVLIPDPVADR